MKRKTITIPLYGDKVDIVKTDDMSAASKKYNINIDKNTEACVFQVAFRCYVVVFRNVSHGIIAHEALHLVRYIYEGIGAHFSMGNDEHQCILLDWIVTKIHEVLSCFNSFAKTDERREKIMD